MNFGNHITEIPAAQIYWPKTNCDNTIAEIGEKKNCGNCGNAIAENGREKKIMVAKIWGGIKKKKCYVHNIFTTNHRWLVIISSNLNLTLRLLFLI